MAAFVDWDLAAATAKALSRSGPTVSYAEAAEVVADLRRVAEEAVDHVREFTGLTPVMCGPATLAEPAFGDRVRQAPEQGAGEDPEQGVRREDPVRVVDRKDWAAANIAGLRQVVNPLVSRLTGDRKPGSVASAVGSRLTGVQAGTVLAYLSGKVLGQYEVLAGEPGTLLLVAPNIVEVERKLEADPRDFRLWVCLHEVAHLTQFTAVPWLRGHFLGEVRAFVDAAQPGEQLVERLRRAVASLADAVRDPDSRASVLDLVQTPAQKAVLDRLTAVMTLLEGHAEFVMDGVGPEVIPSVESIRSRFNQRRERANPVERMLRRLLGIEVKLRQYAEGRRFVHGVVERVGMAGFNRIWDSPLTLPYLSEMGDPDAWVARVHG